MGPKTLKALVVASPAILAFVGSVVSGIAIDHRLSKLTAGRDAVLTEMSQLEQFTKEFESKELLRASFLLGLASANADEALRYTLDKLYRLNAAGSLRRIAATVYPASWRQRVAEYDGMIAADYREAATVRKLQDFEDGILRDARSRLTERQAASNAMAVKIDRLQSRKSTLQSGLTMMMYALTVLVFFFQTAG